MLERSANLRRIVELLLVKPRSKRSVIGDVEWQIVIARNDDDVTKMSRLLEQPIRELFHFTQFTQIGEIACTFVGWLVRWLVG